MIDFAYGTCGFDVNPDGSKRVWLNLSTRTFNGTPYCSAMEHVVAKLSITPESVEPSFAMTMKISPGVPSSYMPIVRYSRFAGIFLWNGIRSRTSFQLR